MSENEPENTTSRSAFLKTDGGKTKSNAIEIPSLNLPKGGGAIKGIDDKFSVNAVNGTAAFSIPLPFSRARGASPDLNLSYNSGSGNGIFGLGWSVSLPSIKRKTDKELPQYFDAFDSDTFLFSEAEDLVPEYEKDSGGSFIVDTEGNYVVNEKGSADGLFTIRFYRPRIEGLFARIERWSSKASGEIKWRIISKENVTTLFGWSAASRISDPVDDKRIFEWLPEIVFDDKGNCARYIYKKEDAAGIDISLLQNRNRLKTGDPTYVNTYLKSVLYGNKTPYKNFGDAFPAETDFMFQTVFDFGEHDPAAPCKVVGEWDFRNDAFSEYKPGFEIRTTRLCRRVLLYHFFDQLPDGSALVRSLEMTYDTGTAGLTFLTAITSSGYIKQAAGAYTRKDLPALEFEYQKHEWNSEVKTLSPDDLVHSPSGLGESAYRFTDLFNEGLSGILTEQANGWYYKHNLGNGNFERAKLVSPKPSFAGLNSGLQLADLDADGGKQLVNYSSEPKGFFELKDDGEWRPFKSFQNLPNIDLNDPNVKMIDLNGDGMPEVLVTEENVFTWYRSEGRKGFVHARRTVKPFDEETGPHIVFSDPKQTIFLADMTGDGLTHIVRIRNGEICYWPNLGYGRFGAKVSMDNAPVFDHPESFNPALIRLADIDGSGTTDIIYLGKNKFTCWMNLSGNAFGPTPFEMEPFPEITARSAVTAADLLGNGVQCIVWSSDLQKDAPAPLKYIDLMSGKKPHIMTGYKNNLGKEVYLEYTPSTRFYIEDKLAGRPWVTKLHFPVHCVAKTETLDAISGFRYTSSYKYHHGYFDHAEREFRGFGMVEQTDSEHFEHWVKGNAANVVEEDLHQAPVLTRSWFHTGAFLGRDKILNQFAHEYWYEEMGRHGFTLTNVEASLPDARLIKGSGLANLSLQHLSAHEWREALRACKGMGLRSEIFAKDAPPNATSDQIEQELTPFSAAAHNCVIELLQPRGQNKHAVFVVKESEAVTYSYERKTKDPRVAHNLNIKLDEYGNVLESASIVYPRAAADTPPETQEAQARLLVTYVENSFTNDIGTADDHRLRVPSETKTYELKGVEQQGDLFALGDFENILAGSAEVGYHQLNEDPAPNFSQKRLIEHSRTLFYNDQLTAALPLHQLGANGLTYESYQLAYTPDLVSDIFGSKVDDTLMLEGRFTHTEGDVSWWVRSGRIQYIESGQTLSDAENRFFSPVSFTDPYGAVTKVRYFSDYFLLVEETEDALQNTSKVLSFNLRSLSPQQMQDANDNISEVLTDELGLVKALAVFGKGAEADDLIGLDEFSSAAETAELSDFFNAPDSDQLTAIGKDLLQHATARFVYDFHAYKNSGGVKPPVAASIVREEHFAKDPKSPVQISFEYSNGLGKVAMKKVQAEPGMAKKVTINPDDTYSINDVDTSLDGQLRWIGNGRTVLNNKGNPVKQYEPYFSVTHEYEDLKELVETGVTPVLYYDAMDRMVKKEFPDGTLSRTKFDSWKQSIYDQNDTVTETDWYDKRTDPLRIAELTAAGKDPVKEKQAAEKADKHAGTPVTQHFDTLGRPVLQVEHNRDADGADVFYRTKTALDIEGNLRKVTDARDNPVMEYKYDMLGNMVYQKSMDAGQRWLLHNIAGNPLRSWDERNHEFSFEYDVLHRPTVKWVKGGDGTAGSLKNIYEKIVYGEGEPNRKADNLRTKPVTIYDTAGKLEMTSYDFKGNLLNSLRSFTQNYKDVVDWSIAGPDSLLESETFASIFEYDAVNRVTRHTTPDKSIFLPSYNQANLLNVIRVTQNGTTEFFVKNIDYDEKGQRKKIVYGNDVVTNYFYDKETFRLIRLETKRQIGDPLQDLYYTFDPAGNITHIEDKNIPDVFFNNQNITGTAEYTYDALYRLVEAAGREHAGQAVFGPPDNWDDLPFIKLYNPADATAWRNYTQKYEYDGVGNIGKMTHIAGGAGWTRKYDYALDSNRLLSTTVGSKTGGDTYSYPHHPEHGFITKMPHLTVMGWDFLERLHATARQSVNSGTPQTTYYQYDVQGQRARKITENQAGAGVEPTKRSQRIYVTGIEIYREYDIAGAADLERQSYHVMEDKRRIAMIETRSQGDDGTAVRLVRYQFGNHLGSASIETDESARVISYEEFHPFGTTSYQATDKSIKAAAKRYRFTGMERDEENGLSYHGARYYMPWLGRWCSADPIGIGDGVNLYAYVKNDPVRKNDPSGTLGDDPGKHVVQKGENVWNIAKGILGPDAAGKDISFLKDWIVAANKLDKSGSIKSGQVLNIPGLDDEDGSQKASIFPDRANVRGIYAHQAFDRYIDRKNDSHWSRSPYTMLARGFLFPDLMYKRAGKGSIWEIKPDSWKTGSNNKKARFQQNQYVTVANLDRKDAQWSPGEINGNPPPFSEPSLTLLHKTNNGVYAFTYEKSKVKGEEGLIYYTTTFKRKKPDPDPDPGLAVSIEKKNEKSHENVGEDTKVIQLHPPPKEITIAAIIALTFSLFSRVLDRVFPIIWPPSIMENPDPYGLKRREGA
jgi:RHS repeat-associated protein